MSIPIQELIPYTMSLIERSSNLAKDLKQQLESHQYICADEQHKAEQNEVILLQQQDTHLGFNQSIADAANDHNKNQHNFHVCWLSTDWLKRGMQMLIQIMHTNSLNFNGDIGNAWWPQELSTSCYLPTGFSSTVYDSQLAVCTSVNQAFAQVESAVSLLRFHINDAKAKQLIKIDDLKAEYDRWSEYTPETPEEMKEISDKLQELAQLLEAAFSALNSVVEPLLSLVDQIADEIENCRREYLEAAMRELTSNFQTN